MKNWLFMLAVLALLSFLLPNCTGAAEPQVKEDIFTVGMLSEIGSMVPGASSGTSDPMPFIYGGLCGTSNIDIHLTKMLATSWENVDPLTWKFNIRKGVRFQNGDPLTSADVQYTFQRLMGTVDKDWPLTTRGTWQPVLDSIDTPDDYTVVFHTKNPLASFPSMLTLNPICPKDYSQKVGFAGFNTAPIGTGPYKMIDRKISETITVEANPYYWNTNPEPGTQGPARIKTVVYRIIPEEQTRIAALISGEIDAALNLSIDSAKSLEKDPNLNVLYTDRGAPLFIAYNWLADKNPDTGEPNPFKDVRVRRALNYAIDWNTIAKNFLTGKEPLTVLAPKGVIGYSPDLPVYPYDPAKARQLLTEAGYANGFKMPFFVNQVTPPMEASFKYMADVGIIVDTRVTTQPVTLSRVRSKSLYGMYFWAMSVPGSDPLPQWFDYEVLGSGANSLHPSDPRVEDLVSKAKAEFDQDKRARLNMQVMKIILEDAWFSPMYEPVVPKVIRKVWDYKDGPATASFILPNIAGRK